MIVKPFSLFVLSVIASPLLLVTTGFSTVSLSTSVSAASASSASDGSSRLGNSVWDDIPMGPPDAILGIAQNFRSCDDPRKVNVCVGAYRDENGKPWVLPSVKEAEGLLLSSETENKEYLPIEGDAAFVKKALKFAYGGDIDIDTKLAGVQTLSGTGACRIGGAYLAKFLPKGTSIHVPTPTWGNHLKIFAEEGLDVQQYKYYDRKTNGLDLDGMINDMKNAPDGSIFLLHACAHNPTGCDPSKDQWETIANVIEEKKHIAFFDSAYQGFASGDAEKDAFALRYVVSRKTIPVLLAQSFAKNFGLYGERCGTFSVLCSDEEQRTKIMSQLKCIVRPMYSSPPKHGSSIVRTILSDDKLSSQYYEECNFMSNRIQATRKQLVQKLAEVGSKHDWSHVQNQIGMFAFTGMSTEMCDELTDKYAIFLTRDGRISVAGLNESNIEYVAKAVHDVTDGKSITTAA